jgi:hypothetical protein
MGEFPTQFDLIFLSCREEQEISEDPFVEIFLDLLAPAVDVTRRQGGSQ